MKVLILLAMCAAAYAVIPKPPPLPPSPTVPGVNNTVVEPKPNGTVPVPTVGQRTGRYIILRDGSVYDRYYDYVIPTTAQLVYNGGEVGNRDVYIRTVPVRSYRPAVEYVYTV